MMRGPKLLQITINYTWFANDLLVKHLIYTNWFVIYTNLHKNDYYLSNSENVNNKAVNLEDNFQTSIPNKHVEYSSSNIIIEFNSSFKVHLFCFPSSLSLSLYTFIKNHTGTKDYSYSDVFELII